jgi:uncharacterized protein YjbI with pentapeptide repeats
MLNSKSIGEKITLARKNKNLSQAELAQQVSISPQAVGKWERGESQPDISTLNRLADIFGVDLNYFSDRNTAETVIEKTEAPKSFIPQSITKEKTALNWDMSQGNWQDADFSGLKNLKDKFSASNMKNCQFIGADLSGLTLGSNNIEHCDFTKADWRDSKIQSSNLLNNTFMNCSFIDSIWSKNNIEKCDFTSANFSGAEMAGVNFDSNIVKEVVWQLSNFKRSNFSGIIFDGLIENCHFEQCGFYNVKFENATILNTFFKNNDKFKRVVFINCQVDAITYAFLKNNQANLSGITMLSNQP